MSEHDISLPDDVSESDWVAERDGPQNQRIRVVVGCLRQIDDILESDYAFLNCSPERLLEIWSTLLDVVASMRGDLSAALGRPSRIPELETVRGRAADSLKILDADLLARIDRYPRDLPEDFQPEIRRLLCATVGQVQAYLGHTLSALLDADPRGMGANDYSLSRRFPRHVYESEWLYHSVGRLKVYLGELDGLRASRLEALGSQVVSPTGVPIGDAWADLKELLDEVLEHLVPALKQIRSMEGIRYDEMQILDGYLMTLPAACHTVMELQAIGRSLAERNIQPPEARLMKDVKTLLAERLGRQVARILSSLSDLSAFVGLWLAGIGNRRALQFRNSE